MGYDEVTDVRSWITPYYQWLVLISWVGAPRRDPNRTISKLFASSQPGSFVNRGKEECTMTRAAKVCGRAAILLLIAISAQCVALGDDFGMVVKNIERHYGARKKRIPLLGLAGSVVKIIHPAGVKSFKLAVFENQNFAPGERDYAFDQAVRSSIDSKWKPMVRSNNRSSGNRAYIYAHRSGKDVEMLTVTLSPRQAIVVQAKVDPGAVSRFLEKPELMGFSLAGSITGSPSVPDPSGGLSASGSGADRRGNSLDNLRVAGADQIAAESRSQPTLKTRSKNDSEFSSVGEHDNTEAAVRSRDVLHLEARLVNLNVKATDRGGAPLPALGKQDFRVFEDGVEQDIFSFEPVSAPVNVVLLLDLSGSTRERRKVMIETARHFIDSLAAGDRIAIAAFTRDFVVVSDFTAEKKLLKKAVDKMQKIEGGTAFYDAMWSTFDLLQRVKESRKAIVVLTDGVDNSLVERGYAPSKHSFDEVLARAGEEEATIYPIYLNPEEKRLRALLDDPMVFGMRRERVERRLSPDLTAHRQLEELADDTSGTIFVAEDERDLAGVYQRVAAELRLTYTLAYAPKNTAHDGKYRRISIAVNRDGAIVKTRRGYVAR